MQGQRTASDRRSEWEIVKPQWEGLLRITHFYAELLISVLDGGPNFWEGKG